MQGELLSSRLLVASERQEFELYQTGGHQQAGGCQAGGYQAMRGAIAKKSPPTKSPATTPSTPTQRQQQQHLKPSSPLQRTSSARSRSPSYSPHLNSQY